MTELFEPGDLPPRPRPRVRVVLMRDADIVVLKELAHRTGYSPKNLTTVGKKFGVCRQMQPGSPLEFSWPAWIMLQYGDYAALDLLREGQRDHPDLARYFREAGVPV